MREGMGIDQDREGKKKNRLGCLGSGGLICMYVYTSFGSGERMLRVRSAKTKNIGHDVGRVNVRGRSRGPPWYVVEPNGGQGAKGAPQQSFTGSR
jgi:hypothetical protein